jgi:hypothetical protein
VDIPLKPKPPVNPSPEPVAATDSASVTGKRKRGGDGADDLEAASEPNSKRLASTSLPDSENNEPIVLDDEDGAITID